MSRHSLETHIEPIFGRGMPSYSQNMAPVGLPQPQSMSSFMGKPYSGAYFAFRPPGKDMAAFPAPWSSTESPVVDRQSPMSHIPGSDRNHIYSKDGRSDEGLPGDVAPSVSKQGFTQYTKSPEPCKPQNTASVIVRKGHTGGESESSDRAVYLGVPHAVYRRSPCTELCCVMGLGSPPHLPKKTVYNHSWKHGESDPLPQHRQGPAEAVRVSMFSPQHNLTYPSAMDRAYSPSKVKEVRPSFQCSPRAYPGFYPSHSAYEPLIYHNTSPISKYGQTVQHPAFYYPAASVDLETAPESKDSGSMHKAKIPVILKHPIQPAGDHYISVPRRDPMSNVNFLQGFEYPGFMAPRLNVNTSPIHGHRHPHALQRDFTSHKHLHHSVGYRDISEEHSSKSVCREQTSPSTCARNSAAGGSRAHSLYAFSPPRTGAYMDPRGERLHFVPPAIHAPTHLNLGVESSKRPGYHVLLHPKHLHVSPPHPASSISHTSNVQKILYCPPRAQTSSHTSPTYAHRGPLKRTQSSPVKTPDEDDVFVVESRHKRRRSEQGDAAVKSTDVSPPLPVINDVFSLAPYRTHLQMSRLHLSTLQSRVVQYSPERRAEQSDEDVKAQFIGSKDVLRIPAVKDDVKDIKPLPGRTEPGSFSKDRRVDSPKAMVIKTETFEQTLRGSDNTEPTMSRVAVQVKQERLEEPEHTCAAVNKSASGNFKKVETNPGNSATKQCKYDEVMDQRSCSDLSKYPELLKIIKKEPEEIDLLDSRRLEVKPELNVDYNRRPVGECGQKSLGSEGTPTHSPAPPLPDVRPSFLNIPPQCLKLSTYNIICPNANLPRSVQKAPKFPEPTHAMPDPSLQMTDPSLQMPDPSVQMPNPSFQIPDPSFQIADPSLQIPDPSFQMPDPSFQIPVRKHFFELHQSLVKLISKSVAATSEDTLRAWLSKMQLSHVASGKTQRVRCLLGAEGRAACLNEEMVESLQQVYQRMNEYSQECCPFPFVMRTGDVFLPILVVKEVLFSSVQGSLIDQVLQEHKVELRPTTLSEEKALIAMNKRAGSSRLRRLMSYKHFPTVYADVVNLLYYTCVCKQLGLESVDSLEEADEPCARSGSRSSQSSPTSNHEDFEELQTQSLIRRRSRIKRSSRLMFLDCSSDEEEPNCAKADSILEPNRQSGVADGADKSWMCPLASEELSVDATEGISTTQHSLEPSVARQFQEKPKKPSGVILKLRRMFDRERTSYKPILESEKLHLDASQSETESTPEARRKLEQTPKVAKWKRLPFSNSLRPLNVYTKRKMRSLLKIKYCPYLSACHSADYRRRWVLRSAVQRARRAMKIFYPDLVGKRIQHLYEEVDKSEVWYRGEVLQVHKAHPDPLKTVFEVRYDSEPEWKYYLELLTDYKKGWLKIEDEAALVPKQVKSIEEVLE